MGGLIGGGDEEDGIDDLVERPGVAFFLNTIQAYLRTGEEVDT